ncbi:hypothetical protein [Paenibacillus alba]|uniref:Uncharacterized protein n=1 Tax=Paenibacillus alba TaxID=1197127 RepID=A0ABU6FZM3_9BACL|nr:hypothetical protein [Paenibacillus alba]MEC0227351.1 hypothetical protein [Paenibacillus alba]
MATAQNEKQKLMSAQQLRAFATVITPTEIKKFIADNKEAYNDFLKKTTLK